MGSSRMAPGEPGRDAPDRRDEPLPGTSSMKKLAAAVVITLGLTPVFPPAGAHGQATSRYSYAATRDYAKWEKEVAAYEAADRQSPPAKGSVLFIGSSTIRLWKTLAD